jgi:hypothetical protein
MTKETQHTPGPWKVDTFLDDMGDHKAGEDTGEIRAYSCTHNGEDFYLQSIATTTLNFWRDEAKKDSQNRAEMIEQAKANARLIAAAPELLAALEAVLTSPQDFSARIATIDQARAAIAKAREV